MLLTGQHGRIPANSTPMRRVCFSLIQRIACTALLCVACNQVESTAPDRAEPPPPPEDDLLAPEQPSRVRRLSHEQWRLSVGELLAVSQDQALASLLDDTVQSFPKDSRTAGYIFDAPGESLAVDALLWNFYSRGAQALAEAVTSQEEYLQNIWPPNLPLEAEEIAGFIEDFGEKVHRRPLSAEELSTYENLYAAIAS
ncbi:MAG: DUF1587 domain-containing protein, partial [Polyangiaceae bacterium]|nr:DUF1587 domain-containing protein [Polyangiaceae bacterium]